MDETERELLSRFPESVEVHRGCRRHNRDGWSWTVDPDKARWFAKRFRRDGGLVITGTVSKADVVAYLVGRQENEVICDPARVMQHKIEQV